MSLISEYLAMIDSMKRERQERYEAEYAKWQQDEANRQKKIGTVVGLGVGALTGGYGGLPFLGIGPGAGGALAGAGLSMIPGGLQMGTMQRASSKSPETTGTDDSIRSQTEKAFNYNDNNLIQPNYNLNNKSGIADVPNYSSLEDYSLSDLRGSSYNPLIKKGMMASRIGRMGRS